MLTKLDLKKDLKHLYNPSAKDFSVVEVPPLRFLMIDGAGDPNTSPAYTDAVSALFGVANAIKFAVKKAGLLDYAVMPLEGLWWAEDMTQFSTDDKSNWLWTVMVAQPEVVSEAHVEAALAAVKRKAPSPALDRVRFEIFHEGLSVQIMHIGPFTAEGPTIARLHGEFMPAHGYVEAGQHHEIYLTDVRRAAPEKWKTVLRQPVRPRG
ncbi:MAG: GyrI-like domain-containing protein [Anaerolineae bacterium]|nr:GyrI-like domain-containing protein [Anaerolineae bacterium]